MRQMTCNVPPHARRLCEQMGLATEDDTRAGTLMSRMALGQLSYRFKC